MAAGNGKVLFVQHQDDDPPGHIGERARQWGLGVDVVPAESNALPDPTSYDLVIPLGSDDSAYDDSLPYLAPEREMLHRAIDADVPVFGICFGAQLLSRVLGGEVRPSEDGPEIGWMRLHTDDPGLIDPGPWLVWHFDVMTSPPAGIELARTDRATQAFRHGPHLGVQFHPEATPEHTAAWSRSYAATLDGLDTEPDALITAARDRATIARAKAHELFDRFYTRVVPHRR